MAKERYTMLAYGEAEHQHEMKANEGGYEPEGATDFYAQLEHALAFVPDYRKVYSLFNQVFQHCVDQTTADVHLNLVGTFAKTDYLLKEYKAARNIVRSTNNTRSRLRKRAELTDDDLMQSCYYDLRNICHFIALLYQNANIPGSLAQYFPEDEGNAATSTLVGDCMRVIVERWDDTFVYGQAEDSTDCEPVKINYARGNKNYDFDWTYLRPLFREGAQINLVRPREKDGILYPELIIYEPDLLVDISSIARCFTNYAESPIVHLINKLSPSTNSEAIVLGNFAGQLLDEEIHQLPDSHTYNDSAIDFWKNNAISLLTADVSNSFHSDAKLQKENIANAMKKVLPQSVGSYDPKEGMVEPSFFCEMLGLQGRMDFLQLDFKVLLEQKSGKGEYPYDNFQKPTFREEHYVQMLLYMMLIRYNFHEKYEANNHELHAFLLYSKYKESLLGLGFAPELMFRAIKIRNGIAWSELHFTKADAYRFMEELTPDALNQKKVNNTLWTRFQYDQLMKFLSPIQLASKLERAYYFRFLTFISNEYVLSKLGNNTKENSGFASTWHDSLEEKLQAGNIYDRLTLVFPDEKTEGNINNVTLQFTEQESNDMSNFRVGDIVILYSYEPGKEPDVRKNMVFRCSIQDISTETIQLILRAPQTDSKIFLREKDKLWAIEHDFMESSYGSLYRGMHAFLSAPKERKDLLMLQRVPKIDTSLSIKGEYGQFDELMTRVKQAQDLFLIIGPPGTGKTSYGMLNTLKEELLEPESSILLLSYTNRAVDEICSKLYEEGIDFVRIGGNLSCSETYRDKLLTVRAQSCKNLKELKHLLTTARVIVATTTSMNANLELFRLRKFSLAIIDEASQILEPHLIGLLSANETGTLAIRKFVMIGDHKQLPAVVQQTPDVSKVTEPSLNEILLTDCRLSLFERLLKKYQGDASVTYMLTKQGRMHQDIAMFPNIAFYGGRLRVVPLQHQLVKLPTSGGKINGIQNILLTRRIAFINAELPENPMSDKVNQNEADIIAATVLKIYEIERDKFNVDHTVGVIVPYRNQIATVRNTIDKFGISALHNITIDTVERYQGSQRRYIVYGFTIQKYYQLNFLTNNVFIDWDGAIIDRKLNVAMTRAQEHLILVGNAELLSKIFTFSNLIKFVKERQGYFDIPTDKYIKGEFDVLDLQEEITTE